MTGLEEIKEMVKHLSDEEMLLLLDYIAHHLDMQCFKGDDYEYIDEFANDDGWYRVMIHVSKEE